MSREWPRLGEMTASIAHESTTRSPPSSTTHGVLALARGSEPGGSAQSAEFVIAEPQPASRIGT